MKVEKDIKIFYPSNIVLDATLSCDEGYQRLNLNTIDPLLYFSWDCPSILKSLCLEYEKQAGENKILTLKYSDYSKLIVSPTQDINLDFTLKLNKDKRQSSKTVTLTIKKPLANLIYSAQIQENNSTSNNISTNQSESQDIKNSTSIVASIPQDELDIIDFIVIEQEKSGISDLMFKVGFLNPQIDYRNYQYTWNVPHFKVSTQYLNGVNQLTLRILYNDLLVGTNKILLTITSRRTNKDYIKNYEYEKGVPPYGGNIIVVPSSGTSLVTEFQFNVNNWKTNSLPLIYKIKYLNTNKILVDLTSGGFSTSTYLSRQLPVERIFYLEVIDSQGLSTTSQFYLNVVENKSSQMNINDHLSSSFDISSKILLLNIFQQKQQTSQSPVTNASSSGTSNNDNSETATSNKDSSSTATYSIKIIDTYFENIDREKFLQDYDNIISLLISITNAEFNEENINTLFKILSLIIENIDPLLADYARVNNLYIILDNLNIKAGLSSGGNKIFLILKYNN